MATNQGSVLLYSSGIQVGSAPYYSGAVLTTGSIDSMLASNGGVAEATQVLNGATQTLASGGTATLTGVFNNGWQIIGNGGFAANTGVYAGGYQTVGYGGSANGTVLNGKGAQMEVQDGGKATGVYVTSGAISWVVSGGVVDGLAVSSGGTLRFSDHGTAKNVEQAAGGVIRLMLYDEDLSDSEISGHNAQGNFYYKDGNYLNFAFYGYETSSGITKIDAEVASGYQAVNTLVDIAVLRVYGKSEKTLVSYGSECVQKNGCASNSIISGYQIVSAGGKVVKTQVQSGGRLVASNGSVISGVTVQSGGSAFISAGAALNGDIDLNGALFVRNPNGGTVNAAEAVLNCNLTSRSTADGVIIDKISSISGGSYSITVKNDQQTGSYKLAGEADSFTGSISVICDGVTLGTLQADGSNCVINDGNTYQLAESSGILSLTVSATAPGAICCSTWTSGQAVSATWNGIVYNGTVGDGLFFNNYVQAESAVGASGNRILVLEPANVTSVMSYDAYDAVLSSDSAYSRMVIGGLLLAGEQSFTGDYTFTIENGTFNSEICGGDAGNNYVDRTGNITLNIKGGTFNGNVIGGGYYAGSTIKGSYTLVGDVRLNISGGTFTQRVYGGCAGITEEMSTLARMSGDVYLTIDASQNAISFGEHVAAGNRGNGLLLGSTNVKVTGLGSNLNFADNSVLFGGCGGDCYKTIGGVRTEDTSVIDPDSKEDPGKRALSFDQFSGNFNAEIRMFSDISFVNNSIVNFADVKLDLSDVSTWNFDCTSLGGNLNSNSFDGDTINIDTDALRCGSWTLLAGDAKALTDISSALSVNFNGNAATYDQTAGVWSDGNYTLAVNQDENNKASLVISRTGIA